MAILEYDPEDNTLTKAFLLFCAVIIISAIALAYVMHEEKNKKQLDACANAMAKCQKAGI